MPGLAPQIRTLWQRIGKDCKWEHPWPRVQALLWLWKGDTIGAVVEFLGNTCVGCSVSSRRARVDKDRGGEEVPVQKSEEDGLGPP